MTTFLLTKPSVLLAVRVILFMWVFQLRSLLMVTPSYFPASTDSSSWLCMKYLDLIGIFWGGGGDCLTLNQYFLWLIFLTPILFCIKEGLIRAYTNYYLYNCYNVHTSDNIFGCPNFTKTKQQILGVCKQKSWNSHF